MLEATAIGIELGELDRGFAFHAGLQVTYIAGLDRLIDVGSLQWGAGPALRLPIFDGGRRRAIKAQTQAAYDASVAVYRLNVLTAFPQVLAMMNDKLDWTQKLGDAFLAQQAVDAFAGLDGNEEHSERYYLHRVMRAIDLSRIR